MFYYFQKNIIRTLMPVTAHTINECTQVQGENSVFEYANMTFHQITFIGIIRNVLKRSSDTTYILDDMTSSQVNVKLQSDVIYKITLIYIYSTKNN